MMSACKTRLPKKTTAVSVRESRDGTYCSILSTRLGFSNRILCAMGLRSRSADRLLSDVDCR